MTIYTLVKDRFELSEDFANEAVDQAQEYMDSLNTLLQSLETPALEPINSTTFDSLTTLDFAKRPSFAAALESFPAFSVSAPDSVNLDSVPDVDASIPSENFDFIEQSISAPDINIESAPEDTTTLETISIPAKPDLTVPDAPSLTDIAVPDAPTIDLPDFDAVSPTITEPDRPEAFSHTDDPYNSDLRVSLFAKILDDIQNGGTGLDATVEGDIYDRGRERQRVENERLYREVEDHFSAAGFGLPSGAIASGLREVAAEISRKNDQLSREITINQAELAQKNTQFSVQEGRVLEGLLMDFWQNQQNRALEGNKAAAQNAIDVFNAVIVQQRLKLEKYQAEAAVFEQKIRAELAVIEIYRAKVEATRATADIQQARANIYNSQVAGLEVLMKLYATEMESAKVQADIQTAQIESFKAKTEAYIAGVGAEKAKVDIYNAQVEGERIRAGIYAERVNGYRAKVEAARNRADIDVINADHVLKTNQQKIEEYRALIDKYRSEIEAEVKNAALQLDAFKAEAAAYEVETNAASSEYQVRIEEMKTNIELIRARLQKAVAQVEATQKGYVALKDLQREGYQGLTNVNAELAASAMNAVNASSGVSSSYSDIDRESINYSAEL